MKRILSILLSVSMTSAMSAPIKIFEDHEETWVVHTETFSRNKDGLYVLISHTEKAPTPTTDKFFVGVEYASCTRGFGEVHIKEAPRGEWQPLTMFTRDGSTIGDMIAKILCGAANIKFGKPSSKEI